jgi:thiamine pyrophosphate-dependent acetolactate synthase large subunit-like protein
LRVAEAIAGALASRGVEVCFGLLGSGNFAVANALRDAGIAFFSARHECGATTMADGYARACGGVGVVSVHQGPGFTNTLTGLTEAAKSRTPLLVLAADTPTQALWSNFKIDQGAVAATLGAIPERVRSPETAAGDAARALRRAALERRPVVLNIPVDLVEGRAGRETGSPAPPVVHRPRPAEGSVRDAVGLIAASERPVVLAGRGAALSPGARDALVDLADRTGALLATSAVGNGIFAGDPYEVGISGGFSSPLARDLLGRADLVLAFGASLNRWTMSHGHLYPEDARFLQVDLDAEALGALYPVEVGVVGDVAATARAVVEELDRREIRRTGFRTGRLQEEISSRRWRDEPFDDRSTGENVDPRALSIALDALLPDERTVSVDSGHFLGWPSMYLSVPDQQGFVFAQAFQSVGLGLASGIGAAVARPERLSVCAVGDGGALMALGELETAARYRLPMLVIVYNDAAYGAEVHHFGPMGRPVDLATFPDTDFAALARAAGAEGITVRSVEDLGPVKGWLGRRDGPLVIDAKVNPEVRAEWLEEAFRAH